MHFSENNILVELEKEDEWSYVLFNPLIGNVDFLSREYYDYIQNLQKPGSKKEMDPKKNEELLKRGYLLENKAQEKERREQFIDYYLKTGNEKKQNIYLVIPQNSCRMGCSYCRYQKFLDGAYLAEDELKKIMDFILDNEKNSNKEKKPKLIFYSGECLPDNEQGFNIVKYVLENYVENFDRIGFHTFGFNIKRYNDLIVNADPKKLLFVFNLIENEDLINETPLLSSENESCLDLLRMYGIQIFLNLKIVQDNVRKIPDYINQFIEKGFLFSENCSLRVKPTFKSTCTLFNPCSIRYDLYQKIFKIYQEYPQLESVTFDGQGVLNVIQNVLKLRKRFSPRTHFCSANWNLLIFAPGGDIFTCYHALQDQTLSVGNINNANVIDQTKLDLWRGRNVEYIEECNECSAKYLCSGGCAYEALAKKGSLFKPDCQPYKELLKWAFESMHEDFLDSERYTPVAEEIET
jgi:uncharacterized protein